LPRGNLLITMETSGSQPGRAPQRDVNKFPVGRELLIAAQR